MKLLICIVIYLQAYLSFFLLFYRKKNGIKKNH